MEVAQVESFSVIGITVKTNNNDPVKLSNDMQNLWNKFMSENIMNQIQGKIDNNIYCIYTEYEGDYTKPYLALLGCKVDNLDAVPAGLIGKKFNSGSYTKYMAKGNLLQGIVYEKWKHIWNSDIARTYIADFEVYGEKSQNLENAEVDIFIGVK
jgi:predicted transcriptional regulator YdeE